MLYPFIAVVMDFDQRLLGNKDKTNNKKRLAKIRHFIIWGPKPPGPKWKRAETSGGQIRKGPKPLATVGGGRRGGGRREKRGREEGEEGEGGGRRGGGRRERGGKKGGRGKEENFARAKRAPLQKGGGRQGGGRGEVRGREGGEAYPPVRPLLSAKVRPLVICELAPILLMGGGLRFHVSFLHF